VDEIVSAPDDDCASSGAALQARSAKEPVKKSTRV